MEPITNAVSDSELAESELALRDRVVASTRAIARGFAHDLNSPLQMLGDAAYLLREELAAIAAKSGAEPSEQLREATAQMEVAFERLKAISKNIAHLVPPAESPGAVVRLEVELRTVAAMTRPEWHRDAELVINVDPRINVTRVPRLLLRQLLVDLVLSVVRFVVDDARSSRTRAGVRCGIELRAEFEDERIRIAVMADGRLATSASDPSTATGCAMASFTPILYQPLLSRHGIVAEISPGFAWAELPSSQAAQDRLFD